MRHELTSLRVQRDQFRWHVRRLQERDVMQAEIDELKFSKKNLEGKLEVRRRFCVC
jgi:hypothetical protein